MRRVVIPLVLQKKVLKEFHFGHPGISRMKSLMRSYTYWPKMDQDIEDLIRHCKGCQLAAKSPPVRTQPWPKTDIPWSRIHMDYAGPLNGYYYLVIVDSYSKWPEVFKYKHPTATSTIKALNEVFRQLGVPNTIVSDNGMMFTGSEFKVCDLLAVEHITTPTYNPWSNGQAERFVDTFKWALKKSQRVRHWREKHSNFSDGLQNNTQSEYKGKFITCQDHICKENIFSIWQVVAK